MKFDKLTEFNNTDSGSRCFSARFASLERLHAGYLPLVISNQYYPFIQWFCSTFFLHPSGTVVICCYSVNSTNNVI